MRHLELPGVAHALNALRLYFGSRKGRKQHRREDRDDGNDDQQFD
jgi:hypothetical protein